MGDVNLEIKLGNLDERVIKIEESGGGSGGDGYITSVSNDFNVINKKLSLSNDVTTKLSKVDTTDNLSVELAKKIDKPASATDGQVLTYNGTSNEWEAQNSKGGSQSIISDAYDELKTYVAGEYCIYNNSLWKCLVQNNGQTPTEGTYWTKVSVANEITSVNNSFGGMKFGVDSDGNYGYIKAGADTVTPFSLQKDFVVIFRYAGNAHNVLLYNATTKKFHYGIGQTFSSDYFSVDSNGMEVTALKKGNYLIGTSENGNATSGNYNMSLSEVTKNENDILINNYTGTYKMMIAIAL